MYFVYIWKIYAMHISIINFLKEKYKVILHEKLLNSINLTLHSDWNGLVSFHIFIGSILIEFCVNDNRALNFQTQFICWDRVWPKIRPNPTANSPTRKQTIGIRKSASTFAQIRELVGCWKNPNSLHRLHKKLGGCWGEIWIKTCFFYRYSVLPSEFSVFLPYFVSFA